MMGSAAGNHLKEHSQKIPERAPQAHIASARCGPMIMHTSVLHHGQRDVGRFLG